MCNKPVLLVSSILMILMLTACAKPQRKRVVELEMPVIEPEGPIDIPNPAELYCIGLGYEYTTRERRINNQEPKPETPVDPTSETHEGPHPGIPVVPDYILEVVCVFPDATECEEWEFMTSRCGQEYSYCVQQGYTLELDVSGATCIFPDGSSCLEYDYFNGDCGPTTSQQTEVTKANPTGISVEALDPWLARNAALAYVIEHYSERAPAPGLTWTEERTDWVGWAEYRYTAEDWVITIDHAVLPPERIVYQIKVTNEITGFEWKGEIDAAWKVTEILAPS